MVTVIKVHAATISDDNLTSDVNVTKVTIKVCLFSALVGRWRIRGVIL